MISRQTCSTYFTYSEMLFTYNLVIFGAVLLFSHSLVI
jgi:hypothetical protein